VAIILQFLTAVLLLNAAVTVRITGFEFSTQKYNCEKAACDSIITSSTMLFSSMSYLICELFDILVDQSIAKFLIVFLFLRETNEMITNNVTTTIFCLNNFLQLHPLKLPCRLINRLNPPLWWSMRANPNFTNIEILLI